jgi:hypothetical protein
LRPLPCLIVALLLTIAPLGRARGAEFTVVPALSLGEEFNDNVYLTETSEKHDYITHITPALHSVYEAPLWDWKLDYSYDFRYYARHSYDDDNAQQLYLRSTTRIMKDILALYVRDDYGRISTSSTRDFTQESLVRYLTQYNALDLNPQAEVRLTSGASVTAGYQYRNVWYKDPLAVDRTVQSVYGDLGWATGARTRLSLWVRQDRLVSDRTNLDRTQFLAGPQYDSGERFLVRFRMGAAATEQSEVGRQAYPVWDGLLDLKGPVVSLHLETGRSWVEDPYRIELRDDRYIAGLRAGRERTSVGIAFARHRYGWGRETDELKHTTTLDVRHGLTELLEGSFAFNVDWYDVRYDLLQGRPVSAETTVYSTDVRLDRRVSDTFGVSLSYHFTNNRARGDLAYEYDVNRLLIEVRKTF